MTLGASEDILAQIERFEQRGKQSIEKLEALQGEIDRLLDIPAAVAVAVKLGVDGRVVELSIDDKEARKLSIDQLEHDINLAFVEATRNRPQLDPERLRAEAASQGLNLSELMASVFANANRGLGYEPSPIWNESRTVSVTVQGSTVLRVACSGEWMRRSSVGVIAAEITRSVNDAIDARGDEG